MSEAANGDARSRTVTICNQRGLHARAAAKFVKYAAKFDADVTVHRDDMVVSGQSIMGLMMLAASRGSQIEIRSTGAEAASALEALCDLVEGGFDEE